MIKSCPDFSAIVRRFATVLAGAVAVSACAGPVAPSVLPPASQAAIGSGPSADSTPLVTTNRTVISLPLLNGNFTLSLQSADGAVGTVTGTYSGTATVASSGNTTASLDMDITDTTGAGASITGLRGDGSGAFAGAGTFSLTLTMSSASTRQDVKVTLRGTSSVPTCTTPIVVTQQGTAATPKFIQLTIAMQHEVGFGGCTP